jgi:hypothetical protein
MGGGERVFEIFSRLGRAPIPFFAVISLVLHNRDRHVDLTGYLHQLLSAPFIEGPPTRIFGQQSE